MSFQGVITTQDTVTAIVNGRPYNAHKSHPNFSGLLSAIKDSDSDRFVELFDVPKAIQRYVEVEPSSSSKSKVEFKDGEFFYAGQVLHNVVTERILQAMNEGFPFEPLQRFLENLMENPSKNSVDQLYGFLAHKNLPVTEDGHFLAYKTVRSDYKDKYSGLYDNHPGKVIGCARNMVDDNPNQHCSYGFHVGALEYAGPGGWYNSANDKVVIVKVNPRDAVAVPTDHSFQKLRVCQYEVLCDYNAPLERAAYSSTGEELESSYEDEDYDDCSSLVDFDDLYADDDIEFDYVGRDGQHKHRRVNVDSLHEGFFVGYLHTDDPSYNPDDVDSNYRNFSFDRVSNARFID